MKTLINYIILIAFGLTYAQDWQPVNSNTSEDLNNMFFISETEGYLVSKEGSVLQSLDSGENWENIYTDATINFNYVAALITNSGETKLMTFGIKEGFPIMLWTLPNEEFVNWTLTSTPYYPKKSDPPGEINGLVCENNIIYFIDRIDVNSLYKMVNNTVTLLANNVSRFGVEGNNIIYVATNYHGMYVSRNGGDTFEELPNYPIHYDQNQELNSKLKAFDTQIRIRFTYPNASIKSLDNGNTWIELYDTTEFSPNYNEIINETTLFGVGFLDKHLNVQENLQPWEPNFVTPEKIRRIYFYNDNLGFVLGENGMVYKTTNMGGVLSSTDVEDLKNKLSIYPNPVTNILSIHTQEDIKEVRVYDTSGKLVLQDNSGATTLRLSSLTKGVYVLKIKTDVQVYTEKFIKK